MKIIIIDDDISFLNLFKAKIIPYSKKFFDNVSVITTSDTTILQNHCFSIYFLDIDLTNDNGIQIATSIKKKNPTAKIIFTTSRNDLIYNAITVQPFYFIRKNELEGGSCYCFYIIKKTTLLINLFILLNMNLNKLKFISKILYFLKLMTIYQQSLLILNNIIYTYRLKNY